MSLYWAEYVREMVSKAGYKVPLFFLGGFPYLKSLQKKVGTLILTSLLEDLATHVALFQF